MPAETNRVVQVKYTNPSNQAVAHFVPYLPDGADRHRQFGFQGKERESMTFGSEIGSLACQLLGSRLTVICLSLSGSNQAREGRLVDALAVRGDERRDTLR